MDSSWTNELTLDRLFILSYGRSGAGKSTFTWTFPNPVIVDFERGLIGARLKGLKIPILTPTKWSDMQDLYSNSKQVIEDNFPGYDAKTLVLDSATFLGNSTGLCMDYIMGHKSKTTKDGQATVDYATIREFGLITAKMRGLFNLSKDLPYHIVIIANMQTLKDDLTGAVEDKPMFIGAMRDEAPILPDITLFHDIESTREGTLEYVAYPVRISRNIGKDRTGLLPPRIVNPTFNSIWDPIQKRLKELDNA